LKNGTLVSIDFDKEGIEKLYDAPAHTLEEYDQIVIDDMLCIIKTLEDRGESIFITVENLSFGPDEFDLEPYDQYTLWTV
jgi:hypothetical protein